MREILFRGKQIDNGKWITGDLVHDRRVKTNEPVLCIWYFDSDGKAQQEDINPETVGQYTGLEDKNGRKIFDGDIVKITDKYGTSYIYVVEYYICALALKQKGVNFWAYFGDFHLRPYEIEVIGNIYDDPELMGGSEE